MLYYPTDPLILVEGKYDQAFLREALKHVQHGKKVQIASLVEFFGPMAKTLCCSKWTRMCSAKRDTTDSGLP